MRNSIMAIFLAIISILIQNSGAQLQYNQEATLYDRAGSSGSSISVNNYEANLATRFFNNRAQSICATGVWLLYDNENYNQGGNAIMEFFFGPDKNCFEFQNLRLRVTSIRHAGSLPDYRSDTLTIYEKMHFQGQEEYTFTDLPNLQLINNHQSLIITGSSSWTLYDLPNYGGNSLCVHPPVSNNYKPAFITDLQNVNVPHHKIKSVRKGCFALPSAVSL